MTTSANPHKPATGILIGTRRTTTKTFRIFKDQLEYLDRTYPEYSSFLLRFLLDAWKGNKIPLTLKSEFVVLVEKQKRENMLNNNSQNVKKQKIP